MFKSQRIEEFRQYYMSANKLFPPSQSGSVSVCVLSLQKCFLTRKEGENVLTTFHKLLCPSVSPMYNITPLQQLRVHEAWISGVHLTGINSHSPDAKVLQVLHTNTS